MSPEGKRGILRKIADRVIDGLGEQLMQNPKIASAITREARSRAAAQAYEDTEHTMQQLADLRTQLNQQIKRQNGEQS